MLGQQAPPPPPPPVPNMSTVAEAAHILTARDEADAVEEADRRDAMNAHRQARDRSRGAAEALYAGEARVAAASAGLPDGWVAQLSRSEREVYYTTRRAAHRNGSGPRARRRRRRLCPRTPPTSSQTQILRAPAS